MTIRQAREASATVYFVTIYKDEEHEAGCNSRELGTFPTVEVAEHAARDRVRREGWPMWSATVDSGYLEHYITEDGIDLPSFCDDLPGKGTRLYLGPDWREEETT